MSDAEQQPPAPRRVNRYDRPPPPHDWRWWVGGIGKVLIVTGLLLFGFVAYQLWGTGIETARAQNSLQHEFEDLLVGASAVTPTSVPPENTASVPSDTGVPSDASVPSGADVPADSVPAAVVATPPSAPIVPVAEGDPIARIEMPTIDVDKYVVAGVAKNDLKKGPGHYPETPMPGQLGNSAIAGHRTTFGQPFYDVDKLQVGDEIVMTTLEGRFVYRVTGQMIVSSSDYRVIATTDPTRATLTLTSCHPKYTARDRIIITADLDVDASSGPAGEPVLNYGRPLDDNGAADASTGDSAPSDTVADPGSATGDDPTISATAPAHDDDRLNDGIADAFSEGWFSDPGANSQVALWGLVLAAIGVASHLISKRARRVWLGPLVVVLPFLVVLYFFYQNVNRLLPPNL